LKLRDYGAEMSIRSYVLIREDEMRAMVYTRDPSGRLGIRSAVLLAGADAAVELFELGVVLSFSVLYEGVGLASDPGAGVE
jgi:hypothetical protein